MARPQTKRLVVCIDNDGYSASLEKRKIYVALRDADAEKHGLLRIVDEFRGRLPLSQGILSSDRIAAGRQKGRLGDGLGSLQKAHGVTADSIPIPPSSRTPSITVTCPSLPFCSGARDIALGLAAPLAGRDDAVEAAADCVQKRLVAERAADQLAPPQRGEGRVVRVPSRKDRRSAARGRLSGLPR